MTHLIKYDLPPVPEEMISELNEIKKNRGCSIWQIKHWFVKTVARILYLQRVNSNSMQKRVSQMNLQDVRIADQQKKKDLTVMMVVIEIVVVVNNNMRVLTLQGFQNTNII